MARGALPGLGALDAEIEAPPPRRARRAGAVGLLHSTDHHYVFPGGAGDLLEVEIDAARGLGLRFHPCRGSMDLGPSPGGLPPDEVVEDRDAILAASEEAIARFHDPAPGAMCASRWRRARRSRSPRELMAESAQLARAAACACTPTWRRRSTRRSSARSASACARCEYLEASAGWATTSGSRTACTSATRRSPASAPRHRRGALPELQRAPRRRHRPGARPGGAGAPVGLGVDGAASNEAGELRRAARALLSPGCAAGRRR